jgi:hypothetical protein
VPAGSAAHPGRQRRQSWCAVGAQSLHVGRWTRLRGNLPIDEEAGAKLALIFRLEDRLRDLDRVELIAHRVTQFTREEAAYWLSRTTSFGPSANRWALSGLRIMLGGHPGDPAVASMLATMHLARRYGGPCSRHSNRPYTNSSRPYPRA